MEELVTNESGKGQSRSNIESSGKVIVITGGG